MAGRKQNKTSQKVILNVVFDTNLIFGNLGVISKKVTEIIKESEGWDILDIRWYISDTVYQEGFNKFLEYIPSVIRDYGSAAGNIKKIFGIEAPKIGDKTEKDLQKVFEESLESNKIVILETGWKNIDTEELMLKACRKVKPFTDIEGKGFRDTLVIENLKQNIESISKKGKYQTIFVVRDTLAEIAVEESLEQVEVMNSIEQLVSSLRLQKSETDEKFIYKINDTANEFFRTSLIYEEEIPQKILERYDEVFKNPKKPLSRAIVNLSSMSPQKKLILREDANFYTSETSFKRKYRGGTFSWESNIRVQRFYDEKVEEAPLSNVFANVQNSIKVTQQPIVDISTSINQIYKGTTADVFIAGEQGEGLTLYDNDSIVEGEKAPQKYDFEFRVTWNSKVDADGNIIEPKILGISFVRQYSPYYPYISI